MVGDNVDGWENRELAEYVKEKEGEGYHIPKKNEMENLLQELGNLAKLDIDVDQISMLMYLTGLYGTYFMAMEDDITRYSLECHSVRYIGHGINPTYYADLLMISCK